MLKHRLYQIIIALDQLFNALCFGWADETFSARCWRQRRKNKFWSVARKLVDLIFFWDNNTAGGQKTTHCELAYRNENLGVHRPSLYRPHN